MKYQAIGRLLLSALALGVAAFGLTGPARSQDSNQVDKAPTDLVVAATATLNNFMNDPEMKWFQQNIGKAKGVLIAPEVAKAGFILGGSGGRALLVVRDKNGKWVGPAFYTLATATVGFQAGVAVSEIAALVMTDKGINSLLSNSFKLGGDASVAAGPVGAGAKSDITADLITFSRSKGVYGGVNLDGTVVKINGDYNSGYYNNNPGVTVTDILVRGTTTSRNSASLLNAVTKAAGGK
jgi:lipid-binding SYLF domain-containing protein